jgi:hypothetical protein
LTERKFRRLPIIRRHRRCNQRRSRQWSGFRRWNGLRVGAGDCLGHPRYKQNGHEKTFCPLLLASLGIGTQLDNAL